MPPDIQNDTPESAGAGASPAATTADAPAEASPAATTADATAGASPAATTADAPAGASPAATTDATAEASPAATTADAPAGASPAATTADAADTVPLARLKGVQRQLSAAEKERESYKALAAELQTRLAASDKRAAAEYAERLRATRSDIVPQLIGGETLEQVEQSLANSTAAFSAAQQAYARQLPTPPAVGNGAPRADDQTLSPLELLRAGLSQPKQDINR